MSHPINDAINRLGKRVPVPCSDQCQYWKFAHLDRACVLSDVFSVRKGEPCYEFKEKEAKS